MKHKQQYQPSPAVKYLDRVLNIVGAVLIVLTVLAVALGSFVLFGQGFVTVPGTITEPVEVTLEDGRAIRIDSSGHIGVYSNFPIGEEHRTLHGNAAVHVDLEVADNDLPSRILGIVRIALWIAAAWVGFVALRRIVSSALAGQPFHTKNPYRLRVLGAAVISAPLVSIASGLLINATLTTDIDVRVSFDEHWLAPLIVGLACLALAEVFAEAARLREFEEATI